MITNLEVATAETNNGIIEIHYGFEENGKPNYDLVTHISEAMLDWFLEENYIFVPLADALLLHTLEHLTEKYLAWYFKCSKVSVTIDGKQHELIYTVKRETIYAWLLVDEDLNIKEPHTLPLNQQHHIRHEAHFAEATKDQPLNF